MKACEFRKLVKANIPEMTRLLKERQKLEGEKYNFLVNDKLNDDHISRNLQKIFDKDGVVGLGAYKGNELIGYMLAQVKYDELRGRHAWIPYEGIAISHGYSEELLRHLYAESSKIWLDYGCFTHYVIVPAGQDIYMNGFQRLSFGFEQVHGILDISSYNFFKNVDSMEVRIAGKNDGEIISSMSDIIVAFQNDSPVYAIALPDYILDLRDGYRGIVDDDEALALLAEKDNKPAGFQAYWPINSDLMIPDGAIELSVAGTLPMYRGSGVGKKLMNEGIKILKEKGYRYIVTDWRITNLASSTFWPKCGFNPIYYRMQRTLDIRLPWANVKNSIVKME